MAGPVAGDASLHRPHVWRPGPGRPPLLVLHGTGGDEHALLPFAERLAPAASLLSPRGTVVEDGGHLRFFRRFADGSLDEDDIRARADDLGAFLLTAGARHCVPAGTWVPVGFSNGATMAAALLLTRPELLAAAVLIAPVPPFAGGPGAADLTGRAVAVVYGLRDEVTQARRSRQLAAQLRNRGAQVTEFSHQGGHVVTDDVLPGLRRFLDVVSPRPG